MLDNESFGVCYVLTPAIIRRGQHTNVLTPLKNGWG
jgi:hypothetical protein